jgi:hypothetical protein
MQASYCNERKHGIKRDIRTILDRDQWWLFGYILALIAAWIPIAAPQLNMTIGVAICMLVFFSLSVGSFWVMIFGRGSKSRILIVTVLFVIGISIGLAVLSIF